MVNETPVELNKLSETRIKKKNSGIPERKSFIH